MTGNLMNFYFKIIAVDDNEVNLRLIEHLAAALGHNVISFSSPISAVDYVKSNNIDIALVDYMMPKMNGIELTKHIKHLQPDVPIIMVTAISDDISLKMDALEAGVTEFLTKPINSPEFKARLNNLTTIRRYSRMLSERAVHLQAEVQKATEVIRDREFETISMLGKVAEYRDEETGEHIYRVGNYSRIIAENIGCHHEFSEQLLHLATLHDIGKIAVSDTILNKPGKLTEEEFEAIKKHTTLGYDILKNAQSEYIKGASLIAKYHHERHNGTGYPEGLSGDNIPLEAQIVALADVFDALSSKRPYKEAWSFADSAEYISSEKNRHFSPSTVDAFLKGIEKIYQIYSKHKHI